MNLPRVIQPDEVKVGHDITVTRILGDGGVSATRGVVRRMDDCGLVYGKTGLLLDRSPRATGDAIVAVVIVLHAETPGPDQCDACRDQQTDMSAAEWHARHDDDAFELGRGIAGY